MIGGAVGTGARYEVDAQLASGTTFPVATLVVNLIGAALLGALAGTWSVAPPARWVPPLVGAGVAGGLTTMSTLAHQVGDLTRDGEGAAAAFYLALSVIGGLLVAGVGYRLAAGRTAPEPGS